MQWPYRLIPQHFHIQIINVQNIFKLELRHCFSKIIFLLKFTVSFNSSLQSLWHIYHFHCEYSSFFSISLDHFLVFSPFRLIFTGSMFFSFWGVPLLINRSQHPWFRIYVFFQIRIVGLYPMWGILVVNGTLLADFLNFQWFYFVNFILFLQFFHEKKQMFL